MAGFLDKIKQGLKTAKDISSVAALFGLPGAALLSAAVEKIHRDPARPNEDADLLNAAAIDVLDRRVSVIEKELKALKGKIK